MAAFGGHFEEGSVRIGLNVSGFHAGEIRGWNRYALNLVEELSKIEDIELWLYGRLDFARKIKERLNQKNIHMKCSGQMNHFLWLESWLPKEIKADRIDLFHAVANQGLPGSLKIPRVLTLHDLIDINYVLPCMSFWQKLKPAALKSQFYRSLSLRRSDHLITVSEFSKSDMVKTLGLPEGKISVTYEAHDAVFRSEDSYEHPLEGKNYFFYVGGFDERKNLPLLIKAMANLQDQHSQLILAGMGDKRYLQILAREMHIDKRVHFVGYIEDRDLPAYYQHAQAFIYPSVYEGFGLQVCEAMAMGCPVFSSNRTSLPEVLGEGGETFEPIQSAHLIKMMDQILRDPGYRQELKERALKRSQFFSWSKTAKNTLKVYQSLLGAQN